MEISTQIQRLNTRIINSNMDIFPNELLNGKMGICIYFYHISKLLSKKEYYNYAERLLLNICDSISNESCIDFNNGLSGIAWGILHLHKKGFVTGNVNTILQDIDDMIFRTYILCPSHIPPSHLVEELLESEGYCIKVSNQEFRNVEIRKFIENVRNSFSGDCISCNDSIEKPFIFKPVLRLNDNFHRSHSNDDMEGRNILHYLNELSLYLTCSCNRECSHCQGYSKQFLFCQKGSPSQIFPFEELIRILDHVDKCGIGKVNFLGGNIFEYKYIQSLISVMPDYDFGKHFFSHISHINAQSMLLINELLKKKCSFSVLVTPDLLPTEIQYCIESTQVEYVLIVDSEISLSMAVDKMNTHPLLNMKIRPFFNGTNADFFSENVFVNLEDILFSPISKKNIFRHQTLNENFFGKMTIMPDGNTYTNMNYKPLGNAFGDVLSINRLVYREMKTGKTWFRLRDDAPCKNCVNRYLCPSISNYEIAIGKFNLCHIKK